MLETHVLPLSENQVKRWLNGGGLVGVLGAEVIIFKRISILQKLKMLEN